MTQWGQPVGRKAEAMAAEIDFVAVEEEEASKESPAIKLPSESKRSMVWTGWNPDEAPVCVATTRIDLLILIKNYCLMHLVEGFCRLTRVVTTFKNDIL